VFDELFICLLCTFTFSFFFELFKRFPVFNRLFGGFEWRVSALTTSAVKVATAVKRSITFNDYGDL
jgi:hypothetical protein